MPCEGSFGEEVGRQLHTRPESRAHHSGPDAAVETLDSLAFVDLAETVPGVAILVLGAYGEEGGEGLQPGFDEEEGRACRGAEDAGGGAGEDVDGEGLVGFDVWEFRGGEVLVEVEGVDVGADGVVEAEAAAVEGHLVDVLDELLATGVDYSQCSLLRTAQFNPRNNPFIPSFWYITRTPCSTPLYNRGASRFACNSPCSCNRILTVSKECVTVTAPQAAIPPAMKDPIVVDMLGESVGSPPGGGWGGSE